MVNIKTINNVFDILICFSGRCNGETKKKYDQTKQTFKHIYTNTHKNRLSRIETCQSLKDHN